MCFKITESNRINGEHNHKTILNFFILFLVLYNIFFGISRGHRELTGPIQGPISCRLKRPPIGGLPQSSLLFAECRI
jgi:hypothetical protein